MRVDAYGFVIDTPIHATTTTEDPLADHPHDHDSVSHPPQSSPASSTINSSMIHSPANHPSSPRGSSTLKATEGEKVSSISASKKAAMISTERVWIGLLDSDDVCHGIHHNNNIHHPRGNRVQQLLSSPRMLDRIKPLCREGIPNSCRGRAWLAMAGVYSRRKGNEGVYKSLVERAKNTRISSCNGDDGTQDLGKQSESLFDIIEKDIGRCFPKHVMFRDPDGDG